MRGSRSPRGASGDASMGVEGGVAAAVGHVVNMKVVAGKGALGLVNKALMEFRPGAARDRAEKMSAAIRT